MKLSVNLLAPVLSLRRHNTPQSNPHPPFTSPPPYILIKVVFIHFRVSTVFNIRGGFSFTPFSLLLSSFFSLLGTFFAILLPFFPSFCLNLSFPCLPSSSSSFSFACALMGWWPFRQGQHWGKTVWRQSFVKPRTKAWRCRAGPLSRAPCWP